ncbi:MAG: gamma-glutamylcyclotransferase [Desulfobacteraceae bacterium]|nr:gamma-glutamylcyclotransferase [Desulfobacteraceae bacterium]
MNTETATYFAYGTLLDIDEMRKYCPSAEPTGLMHLKDHRLGFATCAADTGIGGCTLEKVPGYTTVGMLYTMPRSDKDALDAASGLDRELWADFPVLLEKPAGGTVSSVTFTIPKTAGPWVPPETYTAPILRGARQLNLDPAYIEDLQNIIAAAGK